jgi:hypothetical protein
MGTFLAISLVAVPLFAGLSGKFVPDAVRPRMASPFSAAGKIHPFLEPQFFFDRYAVHYMAPARLGWMR